MLIIWNPNAGSVAAAGPLRHRLASIDHAELVESSTPAEATRLVADRVRNGEELIVAAGGDGTVNAVINGMMQSQNNAILGVLPLGTANDWCSSLHIPDDLDAAWDLIERGVPSPVDVVELNTPESRQYFANIATGGNSHRVTESITPDMKQKWGALCYLRGAIAVLADLATYRIRWTTDKSARLPSARIRPSCSRSTAISSSSNQSGSRLAPVPFA